MPSPDTVVDQSFDQPHIYLTLDDTDENKVLELVKVDGENYYTREENIWAPFDPDADNPRVWDVQIVDVTEEAAEEFDAAAAENSEYITREQFEDFEILDEDGS